MKKKNKPTKIRIPTPPPTKWHSSKKVVYEDPCKNCEFLPGPRCKYCEK